MSLVYIGEPLYEWKTGPGLILITQQGQIINQDPLENLVTCVNIHNKLSYTFQFNHPLCKHMDISPCDNYLAYWLESDSGLFVAVSDAPCGGERTVNLTSRIPKNVRIFQFFWSRTNTSSEPLLILVTSESIELFALGEDMILRTIKILSISSFYSWANRISDNIVLLINNTSTSAILQPYSISNRTFEPLDYLEIEMPTSEPIQHDDIELLTIYNRVYCLHKYVKGGVISLRPLGVKTSYPDIVLSVSGIGKVEICLIDNLLMVVDSRLVATAYDIGFSEESLQKIFTTHIQIPWLEVQETEVADDGSETYNLTSHEFEFELEGISFNLPSVFISLDDGTARPVEINWNRVERFLEAEFAPYPIVSFYLRRTGRKPEIINLLKKLFDRGCHTSQICNVFMAIANEYKIAVQRARDSFSKESTCQCVDGVRLWTVPSETLQKFIGNASIITENDILVDLFYSILNCNFNENITYDNIKEDPIYSRGLLLLLCYFKSLISVGVSPSPALNCLLFDLCVYSNSLGTLKSLIQNGAISSSKLILNRLKKLRSHCPKLEWVSQVLFDMEMSFKDWNGVIDCLISRKDYLLAVDVLWKNGVSDYPLHKILTAAASDVTTQQNNPRLWCNLLNKIVVWANSDSKPPPNLEKCSMWLPTLPQRGDFNVNDKKDKITNSN